MLRQLVLILFLAAQLGAQDIPRISFPQPVPFVLREYLGLTLAQLTALNASAAGFRDYQLYFPITHAEGIGVDYRFRRFDGDLAKHLAHANCSTELITREIETERVKNRAEMQAVLTAAQRVRLAALEEALRLQNAACAAVSFNLLTLPPPPPLVVFEPSRSPLLSSFNSQPCAPSLAGALFGLANAAPAGATK